MYRFRNVLFFVGVSQFPTDDKRFKSGYKDNDKGNIGCGCILVLIAAILVIVPIAFWSEYIT